MIAFPVPIPFSNKTGDIMTSSRDDFEVVVNKGGERRAWVRPAVQRLAAGSAENGSRTSTDVGASLS